MALSIQDQNLVKMFYQGAIRQGIVGVRRVIIDLKNRGVNRTAAQTELLRQLNQWMLQKGALTVIPKVTPFRKAAQVPVQIVRPTTSVKPAAKVPVGPTPQERWQRAVLAKLAAIAERAKRDYNYLKQQKVYWSKRPGPEAQQMVNALIQIEQQYHVPAIPETVTPPVVAVPEPTVIETTEEEEVFDELVPEEPTEVVEETSFDISDVWGDFFAEKPAPPELPSDPTVPTGMETVKDTTVIDLSTFDTEETFTPKPEEEISVAPPPKKGGGFLAAALAIGTALLLGG